jgi:predicted GTPase
LHLNCFTGFLRGRALIFNDLPGIGESARADAAYLAIYRKCLLDSDVVLWAMYDDNRSITFDKQALEQLIGGRDLLGANNNGNDSFVA